MGTRITYYQYLHSDQKSFRDLLLNNFARFSELYLKKDEESLKEFNESLGHADFKAYLQTKSDFKIDMPTIDKSLIDELMYEFLCFDCEVEDSDLDATIFGPAIGTWRYEGSTKLVESTDNQEFIQLWHFLVSGRSIRNNEAFQSLSGAWKIGFLSPHECRQLEMHIERHFGNMSAIKEKYWTRSEKKEEERARIKANGGMYSLSSWPVSTGLECVLQALDKIPDMERDIITMIE